MPRTMRYGVVAGVAALGMSTLGLAGPLAGEAGATSAPVVTFSLAGPTSQGGIAVTSGTDLGPNSVGLVTDFPLTITNNGPGTLSIPATTLSYYGQGAFDTTPSSGLAYAAYSPTASQLSEFGTGAQSCSGAAVAPNSSCDIELAVAPLQSGNLSGTVKFGGDGTQTSFAFTIFGDEGYITATSGAAAAFFDTYGAATGNDDQPSFVDQDERTLNAPIVGATATQTGDGYYLVGSDGGIFTFGDATYHGSEGGKHLNAPIVGMAGKDATTTFSDGGIAGYWEVAADGGIFTFGNAAFYGSMGGKHLNEPIVGMAATPNGGGYWEVAADGGIFTFGNAGFYGSTGSMHLNQPIVGMAPTPDGKGYWLVAADGGIFSFGDAAYYGSTGNIHLNQPIVGMAAVPNGTGYWLEARDAGSFTEHAPYIQDGFTAPGFKTVAISAFGDPVEDVASSAASVGQPSSGSVPASSGLGVHISD